MIATESTCNPIPNHVAVTLLLIKVKVRSLTTSKITNTNKRTLFKKHFIGLRNNGRLEYKVQPMSL